MLTLLAVFLAFFAAISLLVIMAATFGNGPYSINGEPAIRSDYLQVMLPFIPASAAAAIASFGLWKERLWARPLLLGFYTVAGFGSALMPLWIEAPGVTVATGLLFSGILVGFLGWYLYRKQNVVRYYQTLRPGSRA